tara:strand:+ start:596 stop:2341 length:1746 start_codon:yes stop_codon:yes gene_type:complete
MFTFFNKIYFCIDNKDRKYLTPIVFLIIINTLVELIGIGAFIPLINIILSPETYDSNKILIFFSEISFFSDSSISNILIFLIIFFFVVRFFFQSFYFLIVQKFLHEVSLNSTSNLLNIYMKQPIQISLKSKPSVMFKNIYTETNILKANVFLMVKFLSDFLLSLSILLILIYYNTYITVYAALILGSFFVMYLFLSKNYLLNLGKKRYFHNEKLTGILTECINSLREIKLFNMYSYFSKNFYIHKDIDSWSKIMHFFVRQLPIFFVEVSIVIIFSSIIIYFINYNYNTDELIINLGFYAICLIRLMPLVNKIADSYQAYKFNKEPIDKIYEDYQKVRKILLDDELSKDNYQSFSKINFNKNIKFQNVKFFYDENSEFKIDIDDFEIFKNEFIGVYGESGSGKSTFIDLISGLTKPHAGIIKADNADIYTNIVLWRKKIGYVPQNIYLLDETMENNICIIDKVDPDLKDKEYFNKVLEMCDLKKLFLDYKNNSIGEGGNRISGGQKQRIGIARALYKKPEILILDEPTSSLDSETEQKFLKSLKNLKNKVTVIFISHKETNFKDADRVIKITDGRIFEEKKN